jgi:hypothetical protein
LFYRWFTNTYIAGIPESPRYLIAKDRHEEALAVLAKYHANGNEMHPTVQFEYREIRETIKLEQTANDSTSYLDFFKTPGNRYRFGVLISLGFFSQWSGNAIVSNYSKQLYQDAGVDDALSRLGLSAGQTTFSTIVSITFALQVDRWGRRPIWLLATSGMLLSLVLWTGCFAAYETHDQPGAGNAVIFFIWLHGFFYATAWSGLLVAYAIEILPYSLRAKGMMIMNLCVQASLAISNQANPEGFEFWKGETYKLYIIYCCWVAFELVSHPFYKSSNYQKLTDFRPSSTSSTSRPRDQLSRRSSSLSMVPTLMLRRLTSESSRRRTPARLWTRSASPSRSAPRRSSRLSRLPFSCFAAT